jgi:hypothetical protein
MNLPLKDMTLQEKLAAMEALWEDLTRSAQSFESPEWHKDTLEERRQRIADRSRLLFSKLPFLGHRIIAAVR